MSESVSQSETISGVSNIGPSILISFLFSFFFLRDWLKSTFQKNPEESQRPAGEARRNSGATRVAEWFRLTRSYGPLAVKWIVRDGSNYKRIGRESAENP